MSTFPGSVCDTMIARLPVLLAPEWGDLPGGLPDRMVERALRPTDPDGSIGIYPGEWSPVDTEIGNQEPSIQRYTFYAEIITTGVDAPEVRALHSRRSKVLRSMLYRDQELRVALAQLSETLFGVTERFGRFGVARQRFFQEQVQGTFLHLSHLDMWVETTS